jgi:hypothetical protein
MKTNIKTLLFISAAICMITTCKCKKDPDPTPDPGPSVPLQDLTAYSHFKTGTYWIYKDSATLVEDSVYVYFDTAYSYYNSGTPIIAAGNYMFYECRAHSYFDSYDYYYQIDMGYYGSKHSIGTWRKRIKPGHYVGKTFLMSNRFVDGEFINAYTTPGETYFKFFFDSLNIEGKYYRSTVKFYDSGNSSEYDSQTNFYISKNIGIARKERLDTFKIWNLIRYQVTQ